MSPAPSMPATPERFWLTRLAYGVTLGVAIAALDFAHYFPISTPDTVGPVSFAAMLIEWCGEGVLLAVIVGGVERWRNFREFSAWQLALVVVSGALAAVLTWQAFAVIVLRDGLGVLLFRDYLGAPVNWIGGVFYHGWLMLFFGGLAAAVHVSQRRRARMLAALYAAELGRATSQQRLAEARLSSLQARVEPDYLLQTLTRLQRSYETDTQEADRLLDELIAFLRGALADVRGKIPT